MNVYLTHAIYKMKDTILGAIRSGDIPRVKSFEELKAAVVPHHIDPYDFGQPWITMISSDEVSAVYADVDKWLANGAGLPNEEI